MKPTPLHRKRQLETAEEQVDKLVGIVRQDNRRGGDAQQREGHDGQQGGDAQRRSFSHPPHGNPDSDAREPLRWFPIKILGNPRKSLEIIILLGSLFPALLGGNREPLRWLAHVLGLRQGEDENDGAGE